VSQHWPVRQRLQPVRFDILAREDSDDTFERQRGRSIDRHDPCMCVRRANEIGMGLAGKVDVIAKATLPLYQTQVFAAWHRLADAIVGG
jgi:hypothetical protein